MTVDAELRKAFAKTNDALAALLGRIQLLEGVTPSGPSTSLLWGSGRAYMTTTAGTRWVTNSDDNYGPAYYQFNEPSGDNTPDPVYEWEHRGHVIPPDTAVKGLWMKGRANNTSVADIEISLVSKSPASVVLANDGINNDGEVNATELMRTFWMTGTSGAGIYSLPKTGAITHDHWRYFDLSANSASLFPSELGIYLRPSIVQTSQRYFPFTYAWVI